MLKWIAKPVISNIILLPQNMSNEFHGTINKCSSTILEFLINSFCHSTTISVSIDRSLSKPIRRANSGYDTSNTFKVKKRCRQSKLAYHCLNLTFSLKPILIGTSIFRTSRIQTFNNLRIFSLCFAQFLHSPIKA